MTCNAWLIIWDLSNFLSIISMLDCENPWVGDNPFEWHFSEQEFPFACGPRMEFLYSGYDQRYTLMKNAKEVSDPSPSYNEAGWWFFFSIYWASSSQLTNIFQRGWNHQPVRAIVAMVISRKVPQVLASCSQSTHFLRGLQPRDY